MMKVFVILTDVIFLISMTLLGKFHLEQNDLMLGSYQVVVSLFWASGVMKFKNQNAEVKEFILSSLKDLAISIIIIPLWFYMSGESQVDLYEPVTIVLHLLLLGIIIWNVCRTVKLCGSLAYYTQAAIPIIAVILIQSGVPIMISVIIAVASPEFINYRLYKKLKAEKKIS